MATTTELLVELPPTEDVAAGVNYGYAGDELTGTATDLIGNGVQELSGQVPLWYLLGARAPSAEATREGVPTGVDGVIGSGMIVSTASCSITPKAAKEVRIDQGATWWCDYLWEVNDEPIPLDDYAITATIYCPDGSVFAKLTAGNGATKLPAVGSFQLKLTDEQTQTLVFTNSNKLTLTLKVDLERTGPLDPATGYQQGEVVRVATGSLVAYGMRATKAQPTAEVVVTINESTKLVAEFLIQSSDCVALPGVSCWVTTDQDGNNVVAGPTLTDSLGCVKILLDPGTYFLWRDSTEHSVNNPLQFQVSHQIQTQGNQG